MSYSKVSLAKNGAVSPLIYTPNLLPIRGIGTTPIVPGSIPNVTLPTVFDFQKQVIDPLNAEISGAFALHSVDITVAVIGLLLIVVAVSAIAKPI